MHGTCIAEFSRRIGVPRSQSRRWPQPRFSRKMATVWPSREEKVPADHGGPAARRPRVPGTSDLVPPYPFLLPSSVRAGYYGGNAGIRFMNDSHRGPRVITRAEPLPLPENIRSVQPGGGVCYRIELAWGRWRRWWLTHLWPGYVRRMAKLRQGDCRGTRTRSSIRET